MVIRKNTPPVCLLSFIWRTKRKAQYARNSYYTGDFTRNKGTTQALAPPDIDLSYYRLNISGVFTVY